MSLVRNMELFMSKSTDWEYKASVSMYVDTISQGFPTCVPVSNLCPRWAQPRIINKQIPPVK